MARRRKIKQARPEGLSPVPFVGMGMMAASFFLYGASLLVAPWWAVLLLAVVWVALFMLCCRWWTTHPTRLPWVAAGSILLWFVVLVAGGALLDWG